MQRYLFLSLHAFIVLLLSGAINILTAPSATAQIEIERDISLDPSADRTTAEENAGYFSDENLLIVEIYIGRNGTGENIEIFQHEGGFFVPLGYLTRLLEFPIKVDDAAGDAQGWFIRENRIFDLNLSRSEVIVEGKKSSFDPALAQVYYGDIFVEKSLFSEWFPVNLELNFADLIVRLEPRELLPIQARMKRDKARERLNYIGRDQELYPRLENPYRLYSEPFIGVDLGYDYNSAIDENDGNNTPYSVRMSNDIGYTNMQSFLSGDARNGVQGLRSTFTRKNYDGKMLEPVGLSSVRFGDVNAVAIPMVTQSGQGRGVVVSNRAIERSNKFDSRDFIGDAIPGWDVELYRNGVLLDSRVVPSDGRYEFIDVPVLFGNNSFRLVFYGPQGEIREEVENYVIDDSFASEGEFLYDVSIDQKSHSLFGVEERNRTFQHERNVRTAASMLYGVTKKTTVTAGVVSAPIDDLTRHQYLQAGVRQSLGTVLASVNTAYDLEDKGSVLQMIMATSVDDISISAEQQFLNDFTSEVHSPNSQQRQSFSSLNVNGNVEAGLPINYSLVGRHEIFDGEENTRTTLTNRLSTNLSGLFVSNSLNWQRAVSSGSSNKNITGDFSIRGRWMEMLIRPTLTYRVSPEKEFQSASISVQKNLTSTLNMRADLRKDLLSTRLTSLSTTLTKDFDSYRLGTNFQGDSEGEVTFGMNLSFSLGREPRSGNIEVERRDLTNSGAVSARAFLDKNQNQIYDGNDEILPGAGFRANNRLYEAESPADEVVFMPYIATDRAINLQLEQATIDDPFWIASPEGVSILPRPGVTQVVDFPVVITTEIDGEIYLQKGNDSRTVAGVRIELVNKETGEIVKTVRSEFDGFYLMQKVTAGEYYLRIKQEDLEYYGAIEDYRIELSIPEGSDIVSNQNLYVVQSHEMDEDELKPVELLADDTELDEDADENVDNDGEIEIQEDDVDVLILPNPAE